jgi:DnaA-homolog protein
MTPASQLPLALKLRSGSTLASFVVGDNAMLVTALAELAAGAGGQAFLWGTAGAGRSHLLEGVVRKRGDAGVYLAADELKALSPVVLDGLDQFGLVAIDDVDLLAGLPVWEEALFHLYNRLRDDGGAMLFAASAPPAGGGFRLPDLASRLAAGPVWQVRPLDDEGLVRLIRQRGAATGLDVSDEVARYLVTRTVRTAPAVCAELDRLDGLAMAHQRRLTIPFIRSLESARASSGLTKL